jgi:hypothetical protein
MIFIFIHNLKYINIFLTLYTECARKIVYIVRREQRKFENHCSRCTQKRVEPSMSYVYYVHAILTKIGMYRHNSLKEAGVAQSV